MEKKIFLFLVVISVFAAPCWAEQFCYLEQKSCFSDKTLVYYNKRLLAINLPNLKIWFVAYSNKPEIVVFNLEQKLFNITQSDDFQGNLSHRIGASSFDDIKTTKWKSVKQLTYKGISCIELSKIALNQTQDNKSLLEFQTNFNELHAIVMKNYNLSHNQTELISNLYSLKRLINLPVEAYIIQPINKQKKLLSTNLIKQVNCRLDSTFDKSLYKQVKLESDVYSFKKNVNNLMKEFFLDFKQ